LVREILIYPNKILKKESKNIKEFDEKLHVLLDDMYDTMIEHNGVGLAAIQIGVELNVLIINPARDDEKQYKDDLIEAINPKILSKDGEYKYNEGCLSVPEFSEEVKRAKDIKVEYYDRDGNKHINEYSDFMAVAWQHEMDHLNGHLFIEKLSILKRRKFEKELKKRAKNK
jgi:peptide deformylase